MAGSIKAFFRRKILAALRLFKPYRSWSLVPYKDVDFSGLKGVEALRFKEYKPVKRLPPLTTDYKVYWKFKALINDTPQKTFVIETQNWRVWGNQGAAITDNGYLFKDVSREFDKPYHSIFNQLKLVPPVLLKGTSALITASGADMYYHWMFDILPRFKLLMDINLTGSIIDQYIIDYRDDIPFQQEALAALDIDPAKISKSTDHFNYHVNAERLIIPSLPSKLDTVSADACSFLRDTFLDKQKSSPFGKRIYLTRTGKRSITNKVEIESYLERLGFESILCENYSIAEQASIFYHADVVIGAHGAAFTNIVFCEPGTKVIEFFSPRWINPCYWTIANELTLEYYYLVGEGAPPDNFSNALGTRADIEVSLEKLKQLISKFNISN